MYLPATKNRSNLMLPPAPPTRRPVHPPRFPHRLLPRAPLPTRIPPRPVARTPPKAVAKTPPKAVANTPPKAVANTPPKAVAKTPPKAVSKTPPTAVAKTTPKRPTTLKKPRFVFPTGKIPKKRKLWGQMADCPVRQEVAPCEFPSMEEQLEQLRSMKVLIVQPEPTTTTITVDNPVVTQTIEVMSQTEVIQTMIDTYTSNNTGDPTALIPQIEFPLDITARLVRDDKFLKPLWYLPPLDTDFVRGVPIAGPRPTLSKPSVKEALRKSISGLLRLKGFYEANDSALVMLTDGVDEFFKCFMESINDILVNEGRDVQKTVSVATVERGYFAMTRNSVTSLHNYYKNEVVQRNQTERLEYQEIFNEYDRLMQQSLEFHQKIEIKQEVDYMGDYMEAPTAEGSSTQYTEDGGVNVMNFLRGDPATGSGLQGNYDSNGPPNMITNDEHTQQSYASR